MNPIKLEPGKGRLLISEPFLHDPFFNRSVVLLTEHNENGSVGFILNKPINIKLNDALEEFPQFNTDLYLGGPVQRDSLFYIHTIGDSISDSIEIFDGIYWGGNFEALKILVKKNEVDTSELRFFMGYSGWKGDQLDAELKKNSWIVTPAKAEYIMNVLPEKLWSNILKGLGKNYAMLANFPEFPSLN
ncbi:MAG: YqgE/AlgH family protein [Bacteroidota bacterium]